MSNFIGRHDEELRGRNESDVHGPTNWQKENLDARRNRDLIRALDRVNYNTGTDTVYLSTDKVSDQVTNSLIIAVPVSVMFWYQLFNWAYGSEVNNLIMIIGGVFALFSFWAAYKIRHPLMVVVTVAFPFLAYWAYLADHGLI